MSKDYQMRTVEEILGRIKELSEGRDDFFGFQRSDLIEFLPYREAKPFLKEDVAESDWEPQPLNEEHIATTIRKYMPFAWGKANNCRSLSSMRSLEHMKTWLWLIGDEMAGQLEDYNYYGKDKLRLICEKYGVNWRALDDGLWRNNEDDPGMKAPA